VVSVQYQTFNWDFCGVFHCSQTYCGVLRENRLPHSKSIVEQYWDVSRSTLGSKLRRFILSFVTINFLPLQLRLFIEVAINSIFCEL
jgi:hypothetical protein